MAPLQVFVGWDPREVRAYDVACASIRRHASRPVDIHPLKLSELRAQGLYGRADDPLASTEFTYSRFLTPHLAGPDGFALFCDCDFLWLSDIARLFDRADPGTAVQCVQHDYRPAEATKMDGKVQTTYPRKNWSSLMLFNCAHPATRRLTPQTVNAQTGAYLHRMQWAQDEEIGALPPSWNWLEGTAPLPDGPPDAVHFTRGGPWFERWRHVQFADLWFEEEAALARQREAVGAG